MNASVMNTRMILLAINIILGLGLFAGSPQDSFSQTSTDTNAIRFSEPLNLTNNTRDSVYAQVASHEKYIYVVWQENPPPSVSGIDNSKNYDIFMKKSIDGGLTFGKEINLSNNPGFSEHPQIATSGDNVYVVWIDNSPSADSSSEAAAKNKKIVFTKSADNGNTFGETITLSNVPAADSLNQEIAAAGNNVYVVWQVTPLPTSDQNSVAVGDSDIDANNNGDANSVGGSVSFVSSRDNGETFEKVKNLSDSALKSYPKVAAYGDKVYMVWNVGIIGDDINIGNGKGNNNNNNNNNSVTGNGIFFAKSFDNGDNFSNSIKLDSEWNSIGESQVAAYGNNVYIVWGGNPDELVAGNLFYTRSTDNGTSFTTARSLTVKGVTLNVEVAADNDDVYIAFQGVLPDDNQEIYIRRSSDAGVTFPTPSENISNNSGISECTSIVISGGTEGVYLAWEDSPAGNHEILFARNI